MVRWISRPAVCDPEETTDATRQFPDVARRLRERMKEVRTESAEFPMADGAAKPLAER